MFHPAVRVLTLSFTYTLLKYRTIRLDSPLVFTVPDVYLCTVLGRVFNILLL